MGLLEFIKFSLLCIDFLAWPLFALGYPLCASIRAIETDSKYHMRKVVIYWTLFSLISLFELAFIKLIEWIPLWSYIKLVVIGWLVLPRFHGACHVYQRIVHPCLTVNIPGSIARLCTPKEDTAETLMAVTERYIKENGCEAFEKLMASKMNLKDADNSQKDIQEPEPRDNSQTDIHELEPREKTDAATAEPCKEPEVAPKDIKAFEPTETNASNTTEQIQRAEGNNVSRVVKETVADGEVTEEALAEVVKKVQREWTCALCQVTTTSEMTLNCHLQGSKHKAKCEALKSNKNDTKGRGSSPSMTSKSKHGSVEQKKDNVGERSKQKANKKPEESKHDTRSQGSSSSTANKLKNANMESGKGNVGEGSKQKWNKKPEETVEQRQDQLKHKDSGTSHAFQHCCHVCNVKMTSQVDLVSHLKGRKHAANVEQMKGVSNR